MIMKGRLGRKKVKLFITIPDFSQSSVLSTQS